MLLFKKKKNPHYLKIRVVLSVVWRAQFGCGLCFGLYGLFPGGQLGCEFKDLGSAVLNLI